MDVFFALSSFLITTLLIQEQARTGRLHLGAFYIRRILRIWPLYFAFLLADLYLFPALFSIAPLDPAYRAGFFLFYGNWLTAWHGYSHSCVDILWSVSVEEQFYIVWPLLLWLVGMRRLGILIGVTAAIAWVSHIVFLNRGAVHPGLWCNTFVRFEPIAVGAALALVRPRLMFTGRTRMGLGVLGGFVMMTASRLCPTLDGISSLAAYPLAAIAAGLLVCAFAGGVTGSSRVLRGLIHLGRISYGLYVFHLLVLSLIKRGVPGAGVSLLVTILLAEISYRFLEKPFLRLKDRFSPTNGC
jgi:peptidoglycan/LPS O-acetylase OafA/YrhL